MRGLAPPEAPELFSRAEPAAGRSPRVTTTIPLQFTTKSSRKKRMQIFSPGPKTLEILSYFRVAYSSSTEGSNPSAGLHGKCNPVVYIGDPLSGAMQLIS